MAATYLGRASCHTHSTLERAQRITPPRDLLIDRMEGGERGSRMAVDVVEATEVFFVGRPITPLRPPEFTGRAAAPATIEFLRLALAVTWTTQRCNVRTRRCTRGELSADPGRSRLRARHRDGATGAGLVEAVRVSGARAQSGTHVTELAACTFADPELFFPTTYGGTNSSTVMAAKALCARCPLKDDCLDWALAAREEFGIWGGATPIERHRIAIHRRSSGSCRSPTAGRTSCA